ncbi:tetratricopeptide repeat protein [Dactylosporangium sp. NPDC005572]|uniref:tetratricopeptide repeat protein n=1 Tax=Dactylosporangium sp. NPDC005572 TaxID=3156889 RepID=UPI0033B870C1
MRRWFRGTDQTSTSGTASRAVSAVHAGRDGYVAGRDQHFYGIDGPAFTLQAHTPQATPPLAELYELREQPSKLLNARRQVIPFTGRTLELDALRAWRDGPARHGAWLIHGPGGQGKTRLAARAADEAAAAGWTVGYARHRTEPAPGGPRLAPADDTQLLLIADYAERWPQADLHLLLRRHAVHTGPVRVLLLARSINWWSAIDAECDDLGITTRQPLPLPAMAGTDAGRRALFDAACRRFADIYQLTEPLAVAPPGRLADRVYQLTLGLHMAALTVVDAHARGQAPPSDSADLSRYLLDRERRYWTRLHGEHATATAARTVFIAALSGPLPLPAGTALLEYTGLPEAAATSAQHLIDAHARCYPATTPDTVLEPLYPDRLAEDFIGLTLTADPATSHIDPWASQLVTIDTVGADGTLRHRPGALFNRDKHRRPPAHIVRALTFLAAAAARWDNAGARLRTLLAADPALAVDAGGAAVLAVTPHTDASLAQAISRHLPDHSVELNPAAAVLTEHLASLAGPTAVPADRARQLATVAVRLGNAGRRDEAIGPAREAVTIYRRLTEADPAAHLPDLAGSLRTLGVCLSRLGLRDEALGPTEEAVAIYRRLTEADPAAHLPDLAGSLRTLGVCLSRLGLRDEALGPTEEAVAIYRRLTEADPAAHLPDLAGSLGTLGILLFKQGSRFPPLALSREAEIIYRQLAEANPAAYLPDLAASLNVRGVCLAQLGQHDSALDLFGEAITIRRRLADANPAAYLPDLAESLNNLGTLLSKLGRRNETIGLAKEAVTIRRRLADANPAANLPDLASSLHAYASVCVKVNLALEDAHAAALEAVSIYQRLVERLPHAFEADLRSANRILVDVLEALGRIEEAANLRQLP